MQKHTKVYLKHFGYDKGEFIPCEVCQDEAVDIHHIQSRSKFGSKKKDEQDAIENLIALCRKHHDTAHADPEFNKSLIAIHLRTITTT